MGDGGAAILRPAPVGAAVERIGELADFQFELIVLVEISAGGQNAGKQKCGIDRGQFAIPDAAAGLHVEEMIVETLVAGGIGLRPVRGVPEEAKRGERPLDSGGARHETALDTNGIGRQSQPDGGYAGGRRLRVAVGDQAVGRIGLVEKILEGQALDILEKLVV